MDLERLFNVINKLNVFYGNYYEGYSCCNGFLYFFIYRLIEIANNYNFNFNHINNLGETFLHKLVYRGSYLSNSFIQRIIGELILNKEIDINIKDSNNRTIIEAMEYYN